MNHFTDTTGNDQTGLSRPSREAASTPQRVEQELARPRTARDGDRFGEESWSPRRKVRQRRPVPGAAPPAPRESKLGPRQAL